MANAKELIAVSIPAKHPGGARRRAGFVFIETPRIAAVTPEQRAMIKADRYLTIHRRLSQAWFTAMNEERTEKNMEKYEKEDPSNWEKNAHIAELLRTEAGAKPVAKTPLKSSGEDVGVSEKSTKAQLVEGLKALGLKEGEDFEPNATNKILFGLYTSKSSSKTA